MNEMYPMGHGLRATRIIQGDSRVAFITEVVIILLSFIFLLGSLLIWPYIISLHMTGDNAETGLLSNASGNVAPGDMSALVTLGIILCAVLAVSGFIIFWVDRNYHPLRTLSILTIIGVLVSLVYTGFTGIHFIAIVQGNVIASVLAFIVRAMLSCMLAVVPALIFTLVTHVMRTIFVYRHETP